MTTPHPYGTPGAPHLAVRGEAHLETAPDLARIAVTLTARGRDRRTTLDDLTRRNAHALDLLKSYGDAVEHLETGALTVTPELSPHGRGERIRAHHGTAHLTADLGDFTALGALVTRLADLDLTRVDGPLWILRPDSPAHREARRQAVHDALRRAREYAEALGTTLTALIELTDTGTGTGHPDPFARTRSTAFAVATEDAPPPPLDLEPRRQHVHAEVDARFTLQPPRL
ncbi:periplasmic immunogenic protein [Streptomyces caelestis]|uniref:Periplasmic immunogenic protein n=2 Tax=Streptomyces TaxID=1883 RepID=A0A0M8QLH9_9ACTN|nr:MULTISPECIES: SIMPL domain-containing protein [Streptomyces]KOT29106.1 periplasmic immunogenic protein [Streptomyces caelestis]KOV23743.1 periplasmic immunogenic protein [Streptomyces sp. XY152]